ncbi:MAG: alanine--tRNA ligase-related protein, partial [Patescibacteria group bacterium]
AAALNNDPDMFLIDVFTKARLIIEQETHTTYTTDTSYAYRVVLDHIRAATFLIGDGVLPGNKDQGYFVRRLLRRAVRFARKLGVANAIVRSVSEAYIDMYKAGYPNLDVKREQILSAIEMEETKFAKTVEQGLRELKKIVDRGNGVTGTDAFNLYQSYGFPLELTTEELSRTHGLAVDEAQFRKEFKKHQDLSRSGSEQKFAGGLADHSVETTRLHTATHLLHQALREVLGDHVAQKGSNITAERLRFDFSHGEKMTPEQIAKVEAIVNEQIVKDMPVSFALLTVEEAKARGAIGLFEDKYAMIGGKIKVYFMGNYSKEICGGPHVQHTGELGGITIAKEEAVSAGVRRIKAILGKRA